MATLIKPKLKAGEVTVTVREEDLRNLLAIADVVLDCDYARSYCRGIGTTPKGLEAAYDRVRAAVNA